MPDNQPLHIRPQWQKLAARLQHEARKTEGYAVMAVRVLVDGGGNPVVWSEPKLSKLEPKRFCDAEVLRLFGVD
jgi:hypothetical protein